MRHLRFWRRQRAQDDDIDREVGLHLDLAAEARVEDGVSQAEAELAARREFGSVAWTKEELRGMRSGAAIEQLMSHAGRDFLYGLRLLRRSPGFTAVAVLILALPIAATTVVFSLVNTVLLQPRPGRIDLLTSVFSRDRLRPDAYRDFSYPLYADLRDRAAIFDSVMAHTVTLVGIREGDVTRRSLAEIISANYFSTLGLRLAAGRPFLLEEERPGSNALVAIASYAAWRRNGLDPGFVGSQVRVNGAAFTIVGVAPRGFRTTTLLSPDWWFPLGTYDRLINEWFRTGPSGLDDRENHTLFVAGALKPGLTRAAAAQALDVLAVRLGEQYPKSDRDRSFILTDAPRLNLGSSPRIEAPVRFVAVLLLLMAALVLGIACLNLANLMMARGAVRRREIGIRLALGGGRGRIVGQLLMEGLSLSIVGVAAGLVLSWWAHSALTAWLSSVAGTMAIDGIGLTVAPSARMVGFAGGLAVFSTLCFALGPAWRLTKTSVTSDLKDEPGAAARRFGSGTVLVAIQLTVSTALLAVAGLFLRGAVEAAAASPGFALDRLFVFSIDPSFSSYDEARTRDLYRRAIQRVGAIPGVDHTSLASKVAFGEFEEGGMVGAPGRKGQDVAAGFTIITSRYFDTIRLPVLRGRAFIPDEDERVGAIIPAVVSEPLARRLFSDGDALGRTVTLRRGGVATGGRGDAETSESLTVVGVVPGTTQDIADGDAQSQIYVPYGARFRAAMVLHVASAERVDEPALLTAVLRGFGVSTISCRS
jgi:predicted permease